MFSRKKQVSDNNWGKMNTIIGKGTTCEGILNASGSLRLDGDFKGEIKVKGDLVVGENAAIDATIEAENVYIGGYIRGDIQTEGKVDLAPSGAFFGDMLVGHLNVEEGALFKGNCQMHDPKDAGQPHLTKKDVVEEQSQ
ncbi:MAG TPA: polymer-forming cytoskeletal protein [Clostridia bacterium]|nr:polymer-forming cytoskeletal protein [Clostridia bacterium]HHY05461.1 polymer-forming cytoskeletal protein [Clostridia bacterium]